MHNGRRNNNNNNNRRFKNNNNKRRYNGGGGGGSSFDDESSNISMQQRKNFANKRDQYLVKAKDCLSAGDRVEAENFFQHADHCFRMMNLGLTGGSRFDPQRMNIFNPNHQQHHENSEHDEHGHNNESNGQQRQHHQQPQSDNGGSDISSLPFLQSPIDAPDSNEGDHRIIE